MRSRKPSSGRPLTPAPLLDDPVGYAVGKSRDSEAWVGTDRSGHRRAVGHVEAWLAEPLPVRLDHAVTLVVAHRAAAERMCLRSRVEWHAPQLPPERPGDRFE